MKENIKDLLKNEKILSYAIIFIMAFVTCIPLFSSYMNISNDDGIQHICRLIGTYSSIKEGNLFPVIMAGFCNGFGYSWNLFYSPLTAYLPLIFKLFTTSFVLSLKLFMFVTMVLSGIFMYKFVHKISNSNRAGVIAGVIYIIAPYHLTDLYTRIALAELTSFVFLPLVFLGLYNILNDDKKTYYLSCGAIGLILTHNVITIYTIIFSIIYLFVNYKKINFNVIKYILINCIVILLCTSFYWIPLLEHYFATTYEVFVPGRMYSEFIIKESKLKFSDLFVTKPYNMNFHIGIPTTFGIILFFTYIRKIKDTYKKDVIIYFILGIVSIIMALKIFPFEHLPNFLKMIQFTWRMQEFSSFFLSVTAGIAIEIFIQGKKNREYYISIFIVICWMISILTLNYYTKIVFNEEKFLQPIPVDSTTGDIHAGCATFEYLPKKAYSNLDYLKTRSEHVIILDGIASIQDEQKNGTNMSFKIKDIDSNSNLKIELPYVYYLGYSAKLTDENNNIINLRIQESDNGFCIIEVPNTKNCTIEISYTGTTLMKISYITTIIGIIYITVSVIKMKKQIGKDY